MNSQIATVISPKSLEKQLKIVEGRMQTLQAELEELQKIREACLVLLGNSVEAATGKKKTDRKEEETSEEVPAEVVEAADAAPSDEASPTH